MFCEFCRIDISDFTNLDKYFHFLRHYKVTSSLKVMRVEFYLLEHTFQWFIDRHLSYNIMFVKDNAELS